MRPNKINRSFSCENTEEPSSIIRGVVVSLNVESDENTNGREDNMNMNMDKTITQEQIIKIREIIGEELSKTVINEETIEDHEHVDDIVHGFNTQEECKPIEWSETIPFTFPITGGQVIKVYDGDTITIASKLPYPESSLYRLSVRLNGIDTPEIKGKNDDEKQAAKNARDAVSNMIMQKRIRLENVQSEKYGRILADVYFGNIHLNKWLIDNRYAIAYDGGTKVAPSSWLKYKETGEK